MLCARWCTRERPGSRRTRAARRVAAHPHLRAARVTTYEEAYAERWPTVEELLTEIYPRRKRAKQTTAADSNSPKETAVGGRGGKHR